MSTVATKTIDPKILKILIELECEGDLAKMYPKQLDRKVYKALNDVLTACGGKWNRGRKGHVFANGDAAGSLDAAITFGEFTDPKKAFQFYSTPRELVDDLILHAGIKKGMYVLEPSAGEGHIAEVLVELGAIVDCIELNPEMAAALDASGKYNSVVCGDFLKVKSKPTYDAVVMNPPFTRSQDIIHVRKAYDLILPNGNLAAIMAPGFTFRQDEKAEDFRDWATKIGAEWTENPEGSFKASGTNVRTLGFFAEKE